MYYNFNVDIKKVKYAWLLLRNDNQGNFTGVCAFSLYTKMHNNMIQIDKLLF